MAVSSVGQRTPSACFPAVMSGLSITIASTPKIVSLDLINAISRRLWSERRYPCENDHFQPIKAHIRRPLDIDNDERPIGQVFLASLTVSHCF